MLDFINSLVSVLLDSIDFFIGYLTYGPFAFIFGLICVLIVISLLIKLVRLR